MGRISYIGFGSSKQFDTFIFKGEYVENTVFEVNDETGANFDFTGYSTITLNIYSGGRGPGRTLVHTSTSTAGELTFGGDLTLGEIYWTDDVSALDFGKNYHYEIFVISPNTNPVMVVNGKLEVR